MSKHFEIVSDGEAIRCLRCDRVSFNPHDVRERYCGWCHVFHDDEARFSSPAIQRLIEEVRSGQRGNPEAYNRWHNRHNRS